MASYRQPRQHILNVEAHKRNNKNIYEKTDIIIN